MYRALKPGGRVVASFLEFSMPSHWGVFTKTVGEQRTSTVPHLNTFIERSVWQTWAAHLGFETQRQWSDQPIARTTPILLALFSLVTVLALKLSQDGHIPVPVTAWYHKGEPTFSDCLTLVRWHLWRARYLVNSAPEAEIMQFPREALDLFILGIPLAA